MSHRKQKGAALLLIIMVLVLAGSALILSALNKRSSSLKQQLEVREQMALVKELLLAYVVFGIQSENYFGAAGPGRLPCPDLDNDGYPESSCSTTAATFQGRLPEMLDPASGYEFLFNSEFVGIDQQLWYAISPSFHASSTELNSTSATAFTVDGESDIVAVIIAPGSSLSSQSRISNAGSDYLEGGNESGTTYVSFNINDSENPDIFNDQILTITRNEVMTLVVNKVVKEIKESLDTFYIQELYHGNGFSCHSHPMYPRNNYSLNFWDCFFDTKLSVQALFENAMQAAPAWYISDGWDIWDEAYGVTTYARQSNKTATITFQECSIIFTLDYDNGISPDRPECDSVL